MSEKGRQAMLQILPRLLAITTKARWPKNYKCKEKLSLEEIENYKKYNKCFKCDEQGHISHAFPKRNEHNEPCNSVMVEASKQEAYYKDSLLSLLHG